jgi:hypothetical protein
MIWPGRSLSRHAAIGRMTRCTDDDGRWRQVSPR